LILLLQAVLQKHLGFVNQVTQKIEGKSRRREEKGGEKRERQRVERERERKERERKKRERKKRERKKRERKERGENREERIEKRE
jgi:hypothetical protein